MKIVLSLLMVILMSTCAYAERWICWEQITIGSTTFNDVSKRVEGDCLNLGICSGNNNTGIDPNCFEAKGGEWNKAKDANVKVDPAAAEGSRIVDMLQSEIDDIANTQAAAADTSLREGSKSAYDGFTREALILKAVIKLTINEINILRQQIEDISAESLQIADRNLPPRKMSQAKTAIKNEIDSGNLDNE